LELDDRRPARIAAKLDKRKVKIGLSVNP